MKYLCIWKDASGESHTDCYEADVTPVEKSELPIMKEDDCYRLKVIRWVFNGSPIPDLRCIRLSEDAGNYWP